jgi:hypothetical protein
MSTNTFPNWLALMETWLWVHHKGQPAVIFSYPIAGPDPGFADRVKRLQERFGADFPSLVGAEFAVLVCPTFEEAGRILRETPENDPYTLVWDGNKITGHH